VPVRRGGAGGCGEGDETKSDAGQEFGHAHSLYLLAGCVNRPEFDTGRGSAPAEVIRPILLNNGARADRKRHHKIPRRRV
jgi:hypothetical protein